MCLRQRGGGLPLIGSLVVSSRSDHLIQLTDQVTAKMSAFPADPVARPPASRVFSTGAGPAWGISRPSFSHSQAGPGSLLEWPERAESNPVPGRGQVRQVTHGEVLAGEEGEPLGTPGRIWDVSAQRALGQGHCSRKPMWERGDPFGDTIGAEDRAQDTQGWENGIVWGLEWVCCSKMQ